MATGEPKPEQRDNPVIRKDQFAALTYSATITIRKPDQGRNNPPQPKIWPLVNRYQYKGIILPSGKISLQHWYFQPPSPSGNQIRAGTILHSLKYGHWLPDTGIKENPAIRKDQLAALVFSATITIRKPDQGRNNPPQPKIWPLVTRYRNKGKSCHQERSACSIGLFSHHHHQETRSGQEQSSTA